MPLTQQQSGAIFFLLLPYWLEAGVWDCPKDRRSSNPDCVFPVSLASGRKRSYKWPPVSLVVVGRMHHWLLLGMQTLVSSLSSVAESHSFLHYSSCGGSSSTFTSAVLKGCLQRVPTCHFLSVVTASSLLCLSIPLLHSPAVACWGDCLHSVFTFFWHDNEIHCENSHDLVSSSTSVAYRAFPCCFQIYTPWK